MNYRQTGLNLGRVACLLVFGWPMFAYPGEKPATPAVGQVQTVGGDTSLAESEIVPGKVMIDGHESILTIYEAVGGNTPEVRAHAIEGRIIAIASEGPASIPPVRLESHRGWTEIYIGDDAVMAVTDTDAEMAGKPTQELAAEYARNITRAISTYRKDHSWSMILRGMLKTLLATSLLVGVLWLIYRVQALFRGQIDKRIDTAGTLAQESTAHTIIAYAGPLVVALGALTRWLLILGVLEAYFTIVLGFFSSTREISFTVTKWTASQLESFAFAALNYVPNLLVVVVIALVAQYVFRLLHLVFGEVGKGQLKIRGFYPDWADPTERLVRFTILALAVVVAFPYLPGAETPAFQGISIFLGVLLSLGSSSAVANAIAGIILTYMRAFLKGDWVQIGDTMGEVVEKNLLVTRLATPKSEIITIPNATVMNGSVKNYSVEAKKSGVIIHTAVSIGYDAPWRTVHQLLIEAALATEHVLHVPKPFVLQSKLDDFYVCYELNAYTDAPALMLIIYSDLHRNIQDIFNDAGVEICSPHFSSLRDGNTVAIPERYLPQDHKARAFRVSSMDASAHSVHVSSKAADCRPVE